MSVKVNAEQLVTLMQLEFRFAREKFAKVEGITEDQWDSVVNLFGTAEEFCYRLIRMSNASGELNA